LLGKTANVNTTGFIASTADITNNSFMNSTGTYDFNIAGNADASVINKGHISVQDAGLVAFVAPHVSNEGLIEGNLAKVQLGAGDMYGVDLYGDGLISLAVTAPQGGAKRKLSADNSGSIITDGGKVYMTAAAASNVVDSVINNTGVIQAQGLTAKNGEVILTGAGAHVKVSGKIDVSGKNGGGKVKIGGDYQGKGTLAHAAITEVTSGAVINASATETGDGGTIVVWGDEATYFQGTALAQGGANSGNGGLVETSSLGDLFVDDATVNTLAANGEAGTWLLDPANIKVKNTGSAPYVLATHNNNTTTGTANIKVSTINNALTNVLLAASNSITFLADVNIVQAGVSLTARAGTTDVAGGTDPISGLTAGTGDITLKDHYIRTNHGQVMLQSGNTINITHGSTIYTNGGNVIMVSGDITMRHSDIATNGGAVALQATPRFTSGAGAHVVTRGDISIKDSIINTAGGSSDGKFFLWENGADFNTGNDATNAGIFGSTNLFHTALSPTEHGGRIRVDGKTIGTNNNCITSGGTACAVRDPAMKKHEIDREDEGHETHDDHENDHKKDNDKNRSDKSHSKHEH
jgi:hypothetical protein